MNEINLRLSKMFKPQLSVNLINNYRLAEEQSQTNKLGKLRKTLKFAVFEFLTKAEILLVCSLNKDLQRVFIDKNKNSNKNQFTPNISAVDFRLFFKIFWFLQSIKTNSKYANRTDNINLIELSKEKFSNIFNKDIIIAANIYFYMHRLQANNEKRIYFKLKSKKSFLEYERYVANLDKQIFYFEFSSQVINKELILPMDMIQSFQKLANFKSVVTENFKDEIEQLLQNRIMNNLLQRNLKTFFLNNQNKITALNFCRNFNCQFEKFKIRDFKLDKDEIFENEKFTISELSFILESSKYNIKSITADESVNNFPEIFLLLNSKFKLNKIVVPCVEPLLMANLEISNIEEFGWIKLEDKNVLKFASFLNFLPKIKALKILKFVNNELKQEQKWELISHLLMALQNKQMRKLFIFEDIYPTNEILKFLAEKFPKLKKIKFDSEMPKELIIGAIEIQDSFFMNFFKTMSDDSYKFVFMILKNNEKKVFKITYNKSDGDKFLSKIIKKAKKFKCEELLSNLKSFNCLYRKKLKSEPWMIDSIDELEMKHNEDFLNRYSNIKSVTKVIILNDKYQEFSWKFLEEIKPRIIEVKYRTENSENIELLDYINKHKKKFDRLELIILNGKDGKKKLEKIRKRYPQLLIMLSEKFYY